MKLPTFLIIGAPKAGTTSLYAYLSQHPDICLSEPKELHFFDVNYRDDLLRYRLACSKRLKHESAIGEATPHYLFAPLAAERIAKHIPEAKLIVVLRDPVERAYADWWMYYSRATERLSFEEAIESNLDRLTNGPLFQGPEGVGLWSKYYLSTFQGGIRYRPYIDIGYYYDQLNVYYHYFPASQIKVILSDDLRDNRQETLSNICEFIDVRPNFSFHEFELHNQALGPLARPIFQVARLTGLRKTFDYLPIWVKKRVKHGLTSIAKRPQMSDSIRQLLSEHFAPHNDSLRGLLGRSLEGWSSVQTQTC